jgi:hypothetical protein
VQKLHEEFFELSNCGFGVGFLQNDIK